MMDKHEDDKYVIYKYKLEPNVFETQRFEIFDYKVVRPLKIIFQDGVPVLYLLLRNYDYSKNRYQVKFVWTGNPFGRDCYIDGDTLVNYWEPMKEGLDFSYIDTFEYDNLVWHVFGREI